MKKIIILALIPLMLFACKKKEWQVYKLEINSENVVKGTNSIQITVNYSYPTALKSVVGYLSTNSDMSGAQSAEAVISDKQFVLNFNDLAGYTQYYYCYDYDNGVDIIKSDVKNVATDLPGLLTGEFSISATQKVYFSQGNLQYQASTNTWRFASTQLDFMGELNNNISSTYDGWIDLFGWGTGDNPTKASIENADYPVFTDWGNNAISNGGNTANVWRTLTKDEWTYLLNGRNTTSGIRYAQAEVDGKWGLIVLPDNWNSALYNLNNTNVAAEYDSNVITLSDWTNIFEANGAVLLVCAGYRDATTSGLVGMRGLYWSATNHTGTGAYYIVHLSGYTYFPDSTTRTKGMSVRLVKEL